jgi:enoyl-CoA hydratase/carnithine racemase
MDPMIESKREANAFTSDGLLNLQQTIKNLKVPANLITGHGPKFFIAGTNFNRWSTR